MVYIERQEYVPTGMTADTDPRRSVYHTEKRFKYGGGLDENCFAIHVEMCFCTMGRF
jgi:hypothetical protein